MPQKPKKRPPPPTKEVEQTVVSIQNAETIMSTFIKYYKGINLVPEEEWKHFFQSSLSELPFTFRICENHRKTNNILEGKPGTLGQAEVLREFLKSNILPRVANVKVEDVPFDIKPITWFPKQMAWKVNVDYKTLVETKDLKPLKDFIISEERAAMVGKQEVSSMISPLLVDINPNHKILECLASPGYMTTQILEQLYSNPKKLPDGFLIANDTEFKLNHRWSAGTNVYFCHEDVKKFPDMYLTDDHDPNSKLLFDRIFLSPHTSDDGNMRNNKKLRPSWTVTKAQKNHKDLKEMLRRSLELLELNGQLVYTTSSLNPIENEAVIAALLKEAEGTLELVDVRNRLPDFHTRPGMSTWKVMSQGLVFYDTFDSSPLWFQKENEETLFPPSSDDAKMYNLDRCVRVMPHDNDTGAFFIAVITKFGPLPWQKDDEPEAMEEDSKEADKKVDGAGDAEKKKKCPYTLPIRVDVNVVASEIEWTTETTDEHLNTTSSTETNSYGMVPMKISKSCIPGWLKKKLNDESSRFEEADLNDPDWVYYRDLFDIKKVNPLPNLLKYTQEGSFTKLFYCCPAVKALIKCNPDVGRRSRGNNGGMMILKTSDTGNHEVKNVLPFLPFMGKRLIVVTRADLVHLLENKEVVIKDLTEKLQKELESLDSGPVYFLYEPKGKNPDPKCAVLIWREKHQTFIKDLFYSRYDREHNLRLCGIDPNAVGEEEEEAEAEPME